MFRKSANPHKHWFFPLSSGMELRSTVLTHDNLGDFRVWCRDVYRILEAFFIIPHPSAPSFPVDFPRPWLHNPFERTAHAVVGGIDRERVVLFGVLFQCFFSKLHFFPEKGKCIFILRVGVEVKVHFNNSKADLINPGEQLFAGWHLRHHRHCPPPFPQNGLQSSGNKVPFFNAAERS